jgi:hypothetical protein
LVQPETGNWRSPVSEYIGLFGRTSWENIARRKWRLMNWAARETATGLKKGKTRWAVAMVLLQMGLKLIW